MTMKPKHHTLKIDSHHRSNAPHNKLNRLEKQTLRAFVEQFEAGLMTKLKKEFVSSKEPTVTFKRTILSKQDFFIVALELLGIVVNFV